MWGSKGVLVLFSFIFSVWLTSAYAESEENESPWYKDLFQKCGIEAEIAGINRDEVHFKSWCRFLATLSVRIARKGQVEPLCDVQSISAEYQPSLVCVVKRDTLHKFDFQSTVKVSGGPGIQKTFLNEELFPKEPSFDHLPTAHYSKELEAQGLKLELEGVLRGLLSFSSWRGILWKTTLEASVHDADAEVGDGTTPIKVELLTLDYEDQEKVIQTVSVNTEDKIQFELSHAHVIPYLWRNEYREGVLNPGENKFKIRVWDAYSGDSFTDLPVVKVIVKSVNDLGKGLVDPQYTNTDLPEALPHEPHSEHADQ